MKKVLYSYISKMLIILVKLIKRKLKFVKKTLTDRFIFLTGIRYCHQNPETNLRIKELKNKFFIS
jgi:hypothetical protein